MASLEVDEWVLATYNDASTEPLRIQYASRPYVLRPGVPTPIPQTAARLWFGDNRCIMGKPRNVRDADGQVIGSIHQRENEVRRLRQKWGLPFGDERTFLNSDGVLGVPDVTLTSLDGNEEMLTVLQDPLGNGGVLPGSSVPGQDDFARIEYLAREMQLLKDRMTANEAADDPDIDPNDVPVDEVRASTPSFIVPDDPNDTDAPTPIFGGALDEGS